MEGTQERVSVTYENLHKELQPGCHILIDDGLIELEVMSIQGRELNCTVLSGGELSSNKSINIPGVSIALPALTEKDKEDLRFGVENDFDFIAASFVRRASDVEEIRKVLAEYGGNDIGIIAKIENREGVDNLDAIIEAADGIMVARGDLGVEIPAHEVPVLQKRMIKAAGPSGEACHHCDPDAGFYDPQPQAHPRGGVRCGQCSIRRHQLRYALWRDRLGEIPCGGVGDYGGYRHGCGRGHRLLEAVPQHSV